MSKEYFLNWRQSLPINVGFSPGIKSATPSGRSKLVNCVWKLIKPVRIWEILKKISFESRRYWLLTKTGSSPLEPKVKR